MGQHSEYRFSITIKTTDLGVLHCLRALSQYAQSTGNSRIPWGGTKKEDWKLANNCATFHFSKSSYRDLFLKEILRLLPKELWEKIKEDDNDPAKAQSM